MIRALSLASIAFAVSACIEDRTIYLPEIEQTKVEVFEIPQVSPPPLDLLIVVDNSPAMAQVEANVVANLPALGALFEENKGWWDRHIGVVTADVGCVGGGTWRPAELTNDRFFIDWRHLDDTRTKNFEGSLADHLPVAMAAGHDGCGAHRPLDAIVAALDPSTQFRRTDADLIIVIIGASDDQSVLGIDEAIAKIHARTDAPDPFRPEIAIAVIAPEHAARLRAFASAGDEIGTDGLIPISSPNFLDVFGWGFQRGAPWGAHCFWTTDIDVDPAPGMQARCTVADVVRDPETRRTTYDKALPPCTGSNRPCWRVEARPQACTVTPTWGSGYGLAIDRIDFPPMDTIVVGQCEIIETP